jgi:hypothetical protein
VRVRWTLMDADRNEPVREDGFRDRPVATFTPDGDRIQRTFQTVVPAPSSTAIVFLRVTALDDAGEQIAIEDSDRLFLGGTNP